MLANKRKPYVLAHLLTCM